MEKKVRRVQTALTGRPGGPEGPMGPVPPGIPCNKTRDVSNMRIEYHIIKMSMNNCG